RPHRAKRVQAGTFDAKARDLSGADPGSDPRTRPARAMCGSGSGAPEHSLVADSAGEAVRVVALEQELGHPARDLEGVPEAGKRDRLEGRQRLAAAVVALGGDGK